MATHSEDQLDRLREGIALGDGPTAPAQVQVEERWSNGWNKQARLTLCIHEGRKRQVRRMLRAIGYPVRQLMRVEFAGLTLGPLAAGQYRRLSLGEIHRLKAEVGL